LRAQRWLQENRLLETITGAAVNRIPQISHKVATERVEKEHSPASGALSRPEAWPRSLEAVRRGRRSDCGSESAGVKPEGNGSKLWHRTRRFRARRPDSLRSSAAKPAQSLGANLGCILGACGEEAESRTHGFGHTPRRAEAAHGGSIARPDAEERTGGSSDELLKGDVSRGRGLRHSRGRAPRALLLAKSVAAPRPRSAPPVWAVVDQQRNLGLRA